MASGTPRLLLTLALMVELMGCIRAPHNSVDSLYRSSVRDFDRGDFSAALAKINSADRDLSNGDSENAWQLRLLKAEVLIWQGRSQPALELLQQKNAPSVRPQAAERLALIGVAHTNLQEMPEAEAAFREAKRLNDPETPKTACTLLLGEGKIDAIRGNTLEADQKFREALKLAQSEKLPLSEASATGNLGVLRMRQNQYADAVDWFNTSLSIASSQQSSAFITRTLGNLGWSYLEMGDLDRAQDNFEKASEMAKARALLGDQETWLMNLGAVSLIRSHFTASHDAYSESLEISRRLRDQEEEVHALNGLADLALVGKQIDLAATLTTDAAQIAKKIGSEKSILHTELNAALIALTEKRFEDGQSYLDSVVNSPYSTPILRSKAFDESAKIAIARNLPNRAATSFNNGIATLDRAQSSLGRIDFELSYPQNTEDIYDDYVHFLIRRGKSLDALKLIEQHRAKTLSAGLRGDERLSHAASNHAAPTVNDGHVILSYWLGKETSYVWVIGPDGTHMAPLPDQDQIAAAVKRYQSRLTSSFGMEDSSAEQALYRMLVEPVKQWIPPAASITIIPDGALCSLNFETLVVPAPRPHYWIEDVAVHEASSLSLLEHGSKSTAKKAAVTPALLLVGDPKTPVSYPELSHAHAEVDAVAKHFPREQEAVLTGAAATPTAYFAAKPEDYDVIHFVAHGTASRLSPLDSAVVLSDDGKSYNLFARQIMDHPLHARLVTISSCDSAGGRIYSAEGLVGMSWAFLRAGAHQVVAALWQVNDASTPRFMDAFYAEVAQGRDPADALRDAKLAMLHSGTIYAKPFYWAPFVLYEGH